MYETLVDTSKAILSITQDAREAMRVVFFYTYKTYLYVQNEISYIKLHEFANCNSANYDV